ncbi:MAG: hypothetical protein OXC66_11460 [Roseovarius sp.]|nr:hypothetical protein [Roseovarius sp.]
MRRLPHRLGLSRKKELRASDWKRPDVARDRAIWIARARPFTRDRLERSVFTDETSLKLKNSMTRDAGCAPSGTRLIDHAPSGRWNTQTFIAGLRRDRAGATGIIGERTDKEMFDLRVEGILAPASGDAAILGEIGAWLLFPPGCAAPI